MKNVILKLKYSLIICVVGLIMLLCNYFINTSEVQLMYLSHLLNIAAALLFISAFIFILLSVSQLNHSASPAIKNNIIPSDTADTIISVEETSFSLFKHLTALVPGTLYKFQLFDDGRIAVPYASDGIKEIFETTADEVFSDATPLFAKIHPDDFSWVYQSILDSIESLSIWQEEYRILLPEKGLRWVRTEAKPERLDDSVVWYGYANDITDRIAANAELKKTKNILEEISLVAKVGGWEIDLVNNTRNWSSVTREILEIETDFSPSLETSIQFYKEGKDRDLIMQVLADARNNGTPFDIEVAMITAKGNNIWVRTKGQAEMIDNKVVRIYGTTQDITTQTNLQNDLKISKKQFSNTFEHSAIGMAFVNLEAVFLTINQRFSQIVGYTEEELTQLHVSDLTFPEDLKTHQHFMGDLLSGKTESHKRERRYKCKDGSIVWVFSAVSILRDTNNNPLYFIVQIEDITAQKQSEIKLVEERSFLRTLIDNLPVNVFIKDLDSRKTLVNRSEYLTYGLNDETSLIGKSDFDLFPEDIARKNIAEDQEVFRTRKAIIDYESTCLHKDGTKYFVLKSKIPLFNQNNEVTGLLGISHDITHLKEAHEALRLDEEKFRFIYESSPIGIALNDFNSGTFIDCNLAIVHSAGYNNKEEFLNLTYWNLTPKEYEPQEAYQLEQMNKTGRYGPYEKEYIRKDGTRFPVLLNGIKIKDTHGRDVILSVVEDITKKRKQEQEITKAAINAQEKERFEIGRELHDNVNQILVGTILTLDMVKGDLSTKNDAFIQSSRTYVRSAIEEIRKLSHRLAPAFYDGIDFKVAFVNLLNNFNVDSQFEVNLQFNIADESVLDNNILLNLYRILQEQLSNIAKYAQATHIEVGITGRDKMIVLRIADNGIGFDSNQDKKGGIGLHNIKKRAELFNGNFIINTSPDHGCELIIEIPVEGI